VGHSSGGVRQKPHFFRSKNLVVGTTKPCPRRSVRHSVWLHSFSSTPQFLQWIFFFPGGSEKTTTPSPISVVSPSSQPPPSILTDHHHSRRRQNGCLVCVFPLNNVRRYEPLRIRLPKNKRVLQICRGPLAGQPLSLFCVDRKVDE
jgi:hypothetical protein